MKKILILNGPNLNLLGVREPEIYGRQTFVEYFKELALRFEGSLELSYFQSNSEGAILDKLHEVGFEIDGIVLNAGAYTHTSVAIGDAIAAIPSPVVEVHISNVHKREPFRHYSYLSAYCAGIIVGCGLDGYRLALEFLKDRR